MIDVIANVSEITPEWLTQALRSSGSIKSSVTSVNLGVIGTGIGLMAELARLELTFAAPEDMPSVIIAKIAAQNENREVARILDFYNREANFYNKVADQIPFKVPDSYFAKVNDETYDCIILMQDLGDVSPNDQLVGASKEEAFSAIERIASMHAMFWGKVGTPESSWMFDLMSDFEAKRLQTLLYMPALAPTIEKFDTFLDADSRDVLTRAGEQYQEVWSRNMSSQETFVHGDYRQDNFIYSKGSLDAQVLDWQISGRGRGIFDLTYFVCQSLKPNVRRSIEKELVEFYVEKLKEGGVTDYSFEQCWGDYRTMVLGCLVYPVTVCGTLDLANDRGRALAECMLERNLSAISDLGSAELLN
jgi:hypothetical protein